MPVKQSKEQAAEGLWSERGLLAGGARPQGKEGDPYTLKLANGDTLNGRLLYNGPGAHFGGTVDNMDRALFRAMIENCGDGLEAALWLSSWSMSEDQAADIPRRWTELLKSAVGEG